jgi:hypothetical protein
MPCGAVPEGDYAAFFRHLQRILDKAAAATHHKDGPQAAPGGRQPRPQNTPALIHALVLQALELTRSPTPEHEAEDGSSGVGSSKHAAAAMRLPRGGFTDVGPHTGSQPRDTAWPLVREVIKV